MQSEGAVEKDSFELMEAECLQLELFEMKKKFLVSQLKLLEHEERAFQSSIQKRLGITGRFSVDLENKVARRIK